MHTCTICGASVTIDPPAGHPSFGGEGKLCGPCYEAAYEVAYEAAMKRLRESYKNDGE